MSTEIRIARSLLEAQPSPEAVGVLAAYLLRRTDPIVCARLLLAWAGESEETWQAIEQEAGKEYMRRGGRPRILTELR